MFQFWLAQKWYRCSPQRANCIKPRRALVADGLSRLMVRGREHSSTGSGRMMVQSGGGPISHPTSQPFRSWKYVETGTSLYVQPRRQTKLVLYLVLLPTRLGRPSLCSCQKEITFVGRTSSLVKQEGGDHLILPSVPP